MSELIQTIRERRQAKVEQALLSLETANLSNIDTETKDSLYGIVSYHLHDKTILEKWLQFIEKETDTRLKAKMFNAISNIDQRTIPNPEKFVELLLKSFGNDECKEIITRLLYQFAIANEEVLKELIKIYPQQQRKDIQEILLSAFLISSDISDTSVQFFLTLLNKVDSEFKFNIVQRLLRRDKLPQEELRKLFTPTEPAIIKNLVLAYCADRTIFFEEEFCTLLRNEPQKENRLLLLRYCSNYGIRTSKVLEAILHTSQKDPEESVRAMALRVIETSLTITPEIIQTLCTALSTEKNIVLAEKLLTILTLYLNHHPIVVEKFLALTQEQIQVPLAILLYRELGKLLPWKKELLQKFIDGYQQAQHEEIKAVILESITTVSSNMEELFPLYISASRIPSPQIQTWAIHGLLQIPLTENNTELFSTAVDVLMEQKVDRENRILLATKIARIPKKSPTLISKLKNIVENGPKDSIRDICKDAVDKIVTSGEYAGEYNSIDWQQWLYQVEVEHVVKGIFPSIFLNYEANPEMAKKILWAALNPVCSNAMYGEGISDTTILSFLSVRNSIDDNFSRYCINKVLTDPYGGNPNFHLVILKSNPKSPELKTSLWDILEKKSSNLNMVLFIELLEMVYEEKEIISTFQKRMIAKTNEEAILPYLKFLSQTSLWQGTQTILKTLVNSKPLSPILMKQEAQQLFKQALYNAAIKFDEGIFTQKEQKTSGGFAED